MPYYCTVPRCTSMAGKVKNVSFHQFPRDEELAKLWNKILKRGKPYTKYSKVCSLHFRPEDYTITNVGKNKGQWRTLRKDAVPSQNLPSETPIHPRVWAENKPQPNSVNPQVQQVAQAIYMQTMLAMQASSGINGNSSLGAGDQEEGVEAQTSNETPETPLVNVLKSSYKCLECSKCFKDPDVFILHQRTHAKNSGKENLNTNADETLKSNPILANLLKCQGTDALDIQNSVLSIENHIMTAVKVSMENYIRNLLLSQSINNKSIENDTDSYNKSIENDTDSEKDLNESNDSNKLVVDENV